MGFCLETLTLEVCIVRGTLSFRNTWVQRRTDNKMAIRKRINKDLQNTTQKTKVRATRNPLKTGGKRICSERVNRSCSTCGSRLVTNPVISHEWGPEVFMTSGTYLWSFLTQIGCRMFKNPYTRLIEKQIVMVDKHILTYCLSSLLPEVIKASLIISFQHYHLVKNYWHMIWPWIVIWIRYAL